MVETRTKSTTKKQKSNSLAISAAKQQAAAAQAKKAIIAKENRPPVVSKSSQPASNRRNRAPAPSLDTPNMGLPSTPNASENERGGNSTMRDIGNMANELATLKAALAASNAENEELQRKLRDGDGEGGTVVDKAPISRPAGTKFNIQQAMGLGGSERKRKTYKALVRHLHDLTNQARINWESKWRDIPPKDKATLFSIAKSRHPFLARFANDWATEEIVKQYIKNKRKYAFKKGYLDVPEQYAYLKDNAAKRGSGSRRSRANIELEASLSHGRSRTEGPPAMSAQRKEKQRAHVSDDEDLDADNWPANDDMELDDGDFEGGGDDLEDGPDDDDGDVYS